MPDAGAICMPDHAYVPGLTPRHPEEAFDSIKREVRSGMSAQDLVGTQAWRAGLRYLEAGYNWECHEVLEAVWLALPDGEARAMVQALIQLANARLKQKMKRTRAVLRLCDIVQAHLLHCPEGAMGISPDWVRSQTAELRAQVQATAVKCVI